MPNCCGQGDTELCSLRGPVPTSVVWELSSSLLKLQGMNSPR